MEVHRTFGYGFLEAAYQAALEIEFQIRKIPFQREVELPVWYKDRKLSCGYRADFVCHESVVVELKAIPKLSGLEEAQLINYLKASGFERGLLINFGRLSLEFKRFVF